MPDACDLEVARVDGDGSSGGHSSMDDGTPNDSDVDAHAHPTRPSVEVNRAALEAAAGFFRAAGDASRLHLLVLLGTGEWCVSELAESTKEGLSTISQRLKVLRSE